MMRLDKYLAVMGFGTRNEIKKLIKAKEVTVAGVQKFTPEMKIDENTAEVYVSGERVVYSQYVYLMLNKPQGYLSATRSADANVMDLISEPYRDMFPCGRLDKDTEGLLLITNDGPLAHQLLSPKHHVDKEYYVELKNPYSQSDMEALAKGITIDGDEECLPAELIPEDEKTCRLIIQEGKFHEIKRMFEALGNEVVYLKRLRMKNLVLDPDLEPGEYRYLSEEEIADLKQPA